MLGTRKSAPLTGENLSRAGRLLIVAALAVGLTACGGSDSKSSTGGGTSAAQADPNLVVVSSPGKTTAAKNAKVSLTGTIAAEGQTVNLNGDGAINFEAKTFALNLTIPPVGQIEERVIDNVIYVKVPTAQAAQFGGKAWLKIDPRQFSGTGGNPFGSLDSSNPSQILNTLQGASQVTKLGEENVRGTHTVHYRADIDINKAAQAQGLTEAQKQQLTQTLGGKSTVPEDVWIDDSGLARPIAVDNNATPPSTGTSSAPTSVQSKISIEFYDFGTAGAAVEAPPASDVTDFSQIFGQLGQLGSLNSGTTS
jgi:hypothetical protein